MGMRLVQLIHGALPGLQQQHLLPAVQSIIALIAGLWPLANPNEQVARVMDKPELRAFKLEFEPAIIRSLQLLARGAYA